MARRTQWGRVLRRLPPPGTAGLQQGWVETCLTHIDRACREISFCELADVMAKARIAALRNAIAVAQAEDRAGQSGLVLSSRTLLSELKSLEHTLPLEQAFRADQRDLAVRRLMEAQTRLRSGRLSELSEAAQVRIRAALSLSAPDVVRTARHRALTRMGQIW